MVGAHRGEVANLRQDRGLDAPGIAQTLQDELIGGGGTLLALFQVCQVAIGGNAASILGATLAHLNPASVGTVLEHVLAGVAVLRQAPGDPSLTIAPRVLNETAFHRVAKDVLIGGAGLMRPFPVIEEFLVLVVAENKAVLSVVK